MVALPAWAAENGGWAWAAAGAEDSNAECQGGGSGWWRQAGLASSRRSLARATSVGGGMYACVERKNIGGSGERKVGWGKDKVDISLPFQIRWSKN